MSRLEWCACGGSIMVIDERDELEIAQAVRSHQRTTRHLVWREAGGMEGRQRPADAYESRLGQRPG
jgi:hypothetical protein